MWPHHEVCLPDKWNQFLITCCFTKAKKDWMDFHQTGRVYLRWSELYRGIKKSFPSTHLRHFQLGPCKRDQQKTDWQGSVSALFSSTYTKIGTIQRRLAWPLHKDDTQIREAFHIFSKWSNWQTTNLKNIQATYAAQLQKNKWPNQKMGQRTK